MNPGPAAGPSRVADTRESPALTTGGYAARGLVGVLTPQGNTTVEPEFAILMPHGVASIAARMVSREPDMTDRLVSYFARLGDWTDQFDTAPLSAVAIACTGASYLAGVERERELVDALSQRVRVPVITSGLAVVAALTSLGARRIALLSPYPADLTAASAGYWKAHGFQIAQIVGVTAKAQSYHAIYALGAEQVAAAVDALSRGDTGDAVVLLGTGMPSLPAISDRPRINDAPVLSCNLATAWRTATVIGAGPPELERWIDRPHWGPRLSAD